MTGRPILRSSVAALCLLLVCCGGTLIHQRRSDFSDIRVLESGAYRYLQFGASRVVETLMDLREPHRLQHPYSRVAMLGFLYAPQTRRCLLIGLGGGAMVRFINHHFPQVRLDVVEIDPAVVAVAREFFGTGEGAQTRIVVADGFEYLERSSQTYDLILVDAHLDPDKRTDASGHPLTLQSEAFFASIQRRLEPGGVVMFNSLAGAESRRYVAGIRSAFGAVDLFEPPGSGNVIAFASPRTLPGERELRERAAALDRRGDFGFSFDRLLENRRRAPEPAAARNRDHAGRALVAHSQHAPA
ncbi:MAG TPA: fused MFS/spermidine synthase [Burkholderiales bacterium]|nr:fused MFS/spermidine synthase [Burkholderiales bacterium]